MIAMIKNKKSLLSLLLLTLSNTAALATELQGKMEYVKVENDIISFKTDSTATYTQAACVPPQNKGIFTLPLSTGMGRAMYAALMTASAANKPVKVNLATACLELPEYQSVTGITVTELNTAVSSQVTPPKKSLKLVGKGLSYYKDGYSCRIFVTLKNAQGQAYLYGKRRDGSTSCACRNSIGVGVPFGRDGESSYPGPSGYGTEVTCYIEE